MSASGKSRSSEFDRTGNYLDDNDGAFHVVRLCDKPLHFEPISFGISVFFDEASKDLFVVRSNGAGGVVVLNVFDEDRPSFTLEDRGEIRLVRFSPDRKILALQRSRNSVDFVNVLDGRDSQPYCQTCKGKTTRILDFCWASSRDLIFVTDQGVELYEVSPERKTLRCAKTHGVGLVNWSLWSPDIGLLVVSCGTSGHILWPFRYQGGGQLAKLEKFEVELPFPPKEPKLMLSQRDVSLSTLYGAVYVVVLKQDPRLTQGAELCLYQIQKDRPRKTNVVKLGQTGRFQVSFVDNLILVHHQQSQTTFVYDICMISFMDGLTAVNTPVVSPLPIKPAAYIHPFQPLYNAGLAPCVKQDVELYSPNWIVFYPNIVIDARLGCLWLLDICLTAFTHMISDRCVLTEFLLRRANSKRTILGVLKELVQPTTKGSLSVISSIFNMLNDFNRAHASKEEWDGVSTVEGNVITQSDLYTQVFSPAFVSDADPTLFQFAVAVMIEYITSLHQRDVPVQYFLFELLINELVRKKCFYRLHQYLQYFVMPDSKQLACLLLSLDCVYPPASQLALDMLKRLGTANEQIIEVFLSKKQVLTALRYVRAFGIEDTVPAKMFLDAARNLGNSNVFYTVYKHFEERNIRLRKSAAFSPAEACEEFVAHYEVLFGKGRHRELTDLEV